MNPLITKEIRLLLPGYITALLLAVFSAWLSSWKASVEDMPIVMVLAPLFFGTLLLALSSFGREFGMSTFSMLMAQPLTRSRIWWTKLTVLALAMATIFASCIVASNLWLRNQSWYHIRFNEIGGALNLAVAFIVILASALWTSLFFRQIMAALWFALFVPVAIWTGISWFGGSALTINFVLLSYSAVSLRLAWSQFHRAQEVAWTGGVVGLPEWNASRIAPETTTRSSRPINTLFLKELKLHQTALLGMAALFLLHLVAIALRKALHDAPDYNLLKGISQGFPAFWILVPLLTGSLTVADERRLGTMEELLCFPVSTRIQFSIKLLFALVLGGLLSALLLWFAEAIGVAIGAGGGFGGISLSFHGTGLGSLSAFFLAVALVSFYASTLTRNLIQAIAAAIIGCVVLFMIFKLSPGIPVFLQMRLWYGPLLGIIGVPTMIAVLIWLAFTNFRQLLEPRRLWSRNILTILIAMLGIATATTAIYNRTWEYLTRLEPAHGPAILSTSQLTDLDSNFYETTVLLPDGRLWQNHLVYYPGRPFLMVGNTPWISLGDQWIGLERNHFLNGSNWMALASRHGESVAIQSNGTLWVSQKRTAAYDWKMNHRPIPLPSASLVQFGEDSNWKSVVRGCGRDDMVLLKTDGTLWRWGTNFSDRSLVEQNPYQLGSDSDWNHIMSTGAEIFAWKANGEAWKLSKPPLNQTNDLLDADLAAYRWKNFDNMQWRSLTGYHENHQLAVRDDGTLWSIITLSKSENLRKTLFSTYQRKPVQIGNSSDWVSVAASYQMFVALKSDGTLWKWDWDNYWWDSSNSPFSEPPIRLGTHHDWVALGKSYGHITTLAADGSLWNWAVGQYSPLLAPSRKPARMANIFDQQAALSQ
jgi:alpha-tubulin suppressor-like RCC1 family protein/ABC-type transport system involved in multi-copper enzyme maturation permease subunit